MAIRAGRYERANVNNDLLGTAHDNLQARK
jgi:hypothetical protein